MAKAKKMKQISFEMPDKAGLLSEITRVIAEGKINLTAICAYAMENKAYFMLNADSAAKAKKAIAGLGVKATEDDVVGVELLNKPGELHKVAKKIGDAGINIHYMYATAGAGKSSACILKTSDDKKVISLVNK
ncbi:MAG: hypothetical protein C4538_03355 [Nitrospiraceae bacterium]|nr:MAG: hypothetical protein C4538_03355 [Nitrospiraceae bacterium]